MRFFPLSSFVVAAAAGECCCCSCRISTSFMYEMCVFFRMYVFANATQQQSTPQIEKKNHLTIATLDSLCCPLWLARFGFLFCLYFFACLSAFRVFGLLSFFLLLSFLVRLNDNLSCIYEFFFFFCCFIECASLACL